MNPAQPAEAATAARPGLNGPAGAQPFGSNAVTEPDGAFLPQLAGASVPAVFGAP
jgi:hypothetical protein